MRAWHLRKVISCHKKSYIPIAIILTCLILALFAETAFGPMFAFENYNVIDNRSSSLYVPNSSDIEILLTSMQVNDTSKEVNYTLQIHTWMNVDIPEISVRLTTYSSNVHFFLVNTGRAYEGENPWGWFYQPNETITINEKLSGLSQGYPYDYYAIPLRLNFWTSYLNVTFDEKFQPTVSTPDLPGWNVHAYSSPVAPTGSGFDLNVGVVVSRDTTSAVLQFLIPTLAIYFLIGCYLFAKSRDRLSIGLVIGIITLSLYTFLFRQFDWTPVFIQNIAVSLVVSNVILLSFSIISTRENSDKWNLAAMVLASLVPIFFFFISAYSYMAPLFGHILAGVPTWIQIFLGAFVDYRFLYWFALFQLSFWAVYLYKQRTLGFALGLVGVGILVSNYAKSGFSQDLTFSVIGAAMLLSAVIIQWNLMKKKKSYYAFDF